MSGVSGGGWDYGPGLDGGTGAVSKEAGVVLPQAVSTAPALDPSVKRPAAT
jgi:hypothetical protein